MEVLGNVPGFIEVVEGTLVDNRAQGKTASGMQLPIVQLPSYAIMPFDAPGTKSPGPWGFSFECFRPPEIVSFVTNYGWRAARPSKLPGPEPARPEYPGSATVNRVVTSAFDSPQRPNAKVPEMSDLFQRPMNTNRATGPDGEVHRSQGVAVLPNLMNAPRYSYYARLTGKSQNGVMGGWVHLSRQSLQERHTSPNDPSFNAGTTAYIEFTRSATPALLYTVKHSTNA